MLLEFFCTAPQSAAPRSESTPVKEDTDLACSREEKVNPAATEADKSACKIVHCSRLQTSKDAPVCQVPQAVLKGSKMLSLAKHNSAQPILCMLTPRLADAPAAPQLLALLCTAAAIVQQFYTSDAGSINRLQKRDQYTAVCRLNCS